CVVRRLSGGCGPDRVGPAFRPRAQVSQRPGRVRVVPTREIDGLVPMSDVALRRIDAFRWHLVSSRGARCRAVVSKTWANLNVPAPWGALAVKDRSTEF